MMVVTVQLLLSFVLPDILKGSRDTKSVKEGFNRAETEGSSE
jgi:hypothetical protein